MMNKKIRVIICDDDAIYREGLKSVLRTASDIQLIGEVDAAQMIMRKVMELSPDLLLIDLAWYGDPTAGWSAIRDVKKVRPDIKIIALTAFENLIDEARRYGADAALVKIFDKDRLFAMIRELAYRKEDFSLSQKKAINDSNISERELEVLRFIADGKNNKEIDDNLCIAQSTVKNHVRNILSKLDAKNRTEAAAIARQKNIIT